MSNSDVHMYGLGETAYQCFSNQQSGAFGAHATYNQSQFVSKSPVTTQNLPYQDQYLNNQLLQLSKDYKDEAPHSNNYQQTSTRKHHLSSKVIEVYEENFHAEIDRIASLVSEYNYIAMDTEFPGDVYDGASQFLLVRENVNNLKLIQLGITLSNFEGEYPQPFCTWQFNFKFNLEKELYNKSSINLLMNSGINFDKLVESGIDHATFAEYFITSGLIMNQDIHWYGFHTDHDFAYLLRLLTGQPIPHSEPQFLSDLFLIFPNFYDIKQIADQSFGIFRSSLASLCEKLGVQREDDCEHQAGSDSKITAKCFFELKRIGDGSVESCKGEIFGLSRADINSIGMPKTGVKSTFNIKKQGLLEQNRLSFENQHLAYDGYMDDNDLYNDGLNSYDTHGDAGEDTMDSNNSLGKSSFLMMHPGLASQIQPQNQYYQNMTSLDQYQQQEQQLAYQSALYKQQMSKNAYISYNHGSGINTPTTNTTPSPPLHHMSSSPQQLYQQQQYVSQMMVQQQQQYSTFYPGTQTNNMVDSRKSPSTYFQLYRQSPTQSGF